jgi:hypothetical protein
MRLACALAVVLTASSALGEEAALPVRIDVGVETAVAFGERVAFDGEKEGLSWPALAKGGRA